MDEYNNRYSTLTQAVNALQKRGYTDELMFTDNAFSHAGKPLDPALFRIDEFHRFEGPSDPADMSIVYAVSSDKLKLKGLLVNAFGTYAASIVDRMVKPLAAHDDGDREGGPERRAPGEG